MSASVAACLGKSGFLTWRQAQVRCRAMMRRKDTDGVLVPYRCPTCGRFHLGSVSITERQKRRDRRRLRMEGD